MQTIIITIVLLAVSLAIAYKLYEDHRDNKLIEQVTQRNRGNYAEHKFILKLLKNEINPDKIYHDVYLKNIHGNYTQIDCVLVTDFGIIVIEIKDYSGWIFGDGNKKYWTKLLNYGKERYQFYSPIFQNKNHILALKEQSKTVHELPIISVIIFYGDCELKSITNIPKDTYLIYPYNFFEIINHLASTYPPINLAKIDEVKQILKQGVQNGENRQIIEEHARYVATITHNN